MDGGRSSTGTSVRQPHFSLLSTKAFCPYRLQPTAIHAQDRTRSAVLTGGLWADAWGMRFLVLLAATAAGNRTKPRIAAQPPSEPP